MIINNVRKYRRLNDLTQEELARITGTSRTTIVQVEQDGYQPRIGLALEISKVLKVPVEVLWRRLK